MARLAETEDDALLADGQQGRLSDALAAHDWSKGAGPKLKQILQRGVGVRLPGGRHGITWAI